MLFGNSGDESVLAVVLPNGASGTLMIVDSSAAASTNIAWSQSLLESNTANQCSPPGGSITVTTTPTESAGAGSQHYWPHGDI